MLETAYLRSKPEEARTRLIKRNLDADALLSKAAELDEHRRSTQNILDARLAEMNDQSRTIGELMKAGKNETRSTPFLLNTALAIIVLRASLGKGYMPLGGMHSGSTLNHQRFHEFNLPSGLLLPLVMKLPML